MNIYNDMIKLLFPDGYHIYENQPLWKLKKTLTYEEWNKVKPFFKYYSHTDKNCKNCKYYGWMTTQPEQVIMALNEITLKNENQMVLI